MLLILVLKARVRRLPYACHVLRGRDSLWGGGAQDLEASRVLSDNLHEASREQSPIDFLSGSV